MLDGEWHKGNKDQYSTIKISDFGSAVFQAAGQEFEEVYGSPYYAAPEVLLSKYDHRCDIWSIGIILYMLLLGQPPFDGYSYLQIAEKVKRNLINTGVDFEDLSAEARDLILKLLTWDPDDRIKLEEALEHNWIKKYEQRDQDNQLVMEALVALSQFNTQ